MTTKITSRLDEIEASVDELRSVKCVDPSRCGRYGWRTCDACSNAQIVAEGFIALVRAAQELAGYTRAHLAGNDADPELTWALVKYDEARAEFEEGK